MKKKTKHTESANGLLPGEHKDIVLDVREIVPDADNWLDTPNVHFDGDKPRDAIGTDCEWLLRNILRSVKYGGVS
jgi:hypothetical protein